MAVAQKKSRPCADDTHDAARCTDDFFGRRYSDHMQENNPESRTDPGNEVAGKKSNCADGSFKGRTENIQRIYIKEQMDRAVVEKERSQEPPIFASRKKIPRLELTEAVQREWIHRSAEQKSRAETSQHSER